jgi:L-threonylcarbamoyladenylate synthase|tara:strand:+ start:3522 stop:4082 length:561 start_codon:yes stop_codon:yes gene_type:complete
LNKKKLDVFTSAEWLKSGKILAHPTESIWGLGCDAFNKRSVEKIFSLKKRDKKKNLIVLADSIDSINKELCYLSSEDKKFLSNYWPGPYTFLINYLAHIPDHLKNETNKIAIRVSNHLPVKQLFKSFNGFIVSTSANISGKDVINDPKEILNVFEYEELAYYDERLGKNKSPSQIIDLDTRRIIRA